MIERTNLTIEEFLSKYMGQNQHERTKFLPLAMMAYRSSIHSVTKYSPAYVGLGFALLLPLDCIYNTLQTNDVFVSVNFRRKKRNKKRRVRPEHRVMEYHYACIWQFQPYLLLLHLVSSYTVMILTITY